MFETSKSNSSSPNQQCVGQGVLQFERADWMERGACFGQDPEIFHIEGKYVLGSARYRMAVAHARSFCDECPVQDDCLAYGMRQPEGIWGGKTSGQRRRMKRGLITLVEGNPE